LGEFHHSKGFFGGAYKEKRGSWSFWGETKNTKKTLMAPPGE